MKGVALFIYATFCGLINLLSLNRFWEKERHQVSGRHGSAMVILSSTMCRDLWSCGLLSPHEHAQQGGYAKLNVMFTHSVFTDTPRGHATKPTKLGFVAFIRFCSLYKTAVLNQITANEVMGLCHRRRQILRVQLLNVQ